MPAPIYRAAYEPCPAVMSKLLEDFTAEVIENAKTKKPRGFFDEQEEHQANHRLTIRQPIDRLFFYVAGILMTPGIALAVYFFFFR